MRSVSAEHDRLAVPPALIDPKTFIFSSNALPLVAWPAFEHGKIIFPSERAPDQEFGSGDLVVTYPLDNFGRLTVTTGARSARVTADFSSEGATPHAAAYWFRNQAVAGSQVRYNPNGSHVDGLYGQGSAQTPAIVVVPPNTSVILLVRGDAGDGNQRASIGASITVQEVV